MRELTRCLAAGWETLSRCGIGLGAVASCWLWLILVLPAHLAAETTGQLQGAVADEQGAPLPGVRVVATSPAQIGGEQLAVTDVRGGFRYPVLAPGDYSVRFALDGYVPQEITSVQIRVDRTTEIRVTLPLAAFEAELVVSERTPVVDPVQTSAGQTLTAEYLEKAAIGMDNRHYVGVAAQAAGVNQRGSSQLPLLSVHGSREWESAFLIDGVDSTLPGEGLHTFDTLGFEAVQEVVVHSAGFGAEYGFAAGGVLNVVTRAGGNAFSGSFDFRYRDESFEASGDHYDPDEEPSDRFVASAALGGPILRDRLWFFLSSGSDRSERVPVDTAYSSEVDILTLLAKLTWQATPGWSLVARWADQDLTAERFNGDQFRSEEATASATYDPTSVSLHSTAVLSSRTVWSAQLDEFDIPNEFGPADGDLTTLAHRNLVTGETYGNAGLLDSSKQGRREAQADISWFIPEARGAHQVKVGFRLSDLWVRDNACPPGNGPCREGVTGLRFRDGVEENGGPSPLQMHAQANLGWQSFDASQRSVFVQDRWSVHPDVSLEIGVRWDDVEQTNDIGHQVIDYDLLQPRLGLAWDVGGTSRTIVRASWGRFMNPSLLQLASVLAERFSPTEVWLSCSTFIAADPQACRSVAAAVGLGYRTDPESWDSAGWFLDPALVFGSEPLQVAPDLEPISTDALVLGVERELFRRTSLELSYIHKEAKDLIEDTCAANLPQPMSTGQCPGYVLANLPQAWRKYEALTLRFESRALDRFHVIASWVYSESTGTEVNSYTGTLFDLYPWHFANLAGYLPDHSRHRVRLNGFVDLPWDTVLGFGASWQSEFRWTPQDFLTPPYGVEFVEPRGSRKGNGLYNLDLQLGKSFPLASTTWTLLASVYNALNSERPTAVCDSVSGCGSEFVLGDPLSWQQPRRYEVGVRFRF